MATTASKGLSKAEMKLLNDFANTANAREFTEGVKIQKLSLSYDIASGFSIELVETRNSDPEPPVSEA